LASYEAKKDELAALGVAVVAATTGDKESTIAMAEEYGLTMPIGYGVTDEMAAEYDPWYGDDHHGHYHQPMEFLISRGGSIFGAMYATGPIGRMFVDEVIVSVTSREQRRLNPTN
jgi:peroxiredoxin